MFAIYGRKLLLTIDAHEGLKRDLGGRVSNITLLTNTFTSYASGVSCKPSAAACFSRFLR
jgi:hypothetical protein